MDALDESFNLVIGWARRELVGDYVAGLGFASYQTYAAGDRTIVFSQIQD